MTAPSHITAKNSALGCVDLALSQCAIGLNLVTAKLLISTQVPFIFFMQLRFTLGALLLWPILLIRKEAFFVNASGHRFTSKDKQVIFWQAASGGFIFNVLMMIALQHASATIAGITFSTFPVVLALLSWIILREAFSRNQLYALILAAIGVFMINLGKKQGLNLENNSWIGFSFVMLSMIPESLFIILGKWHDCKISPYVMTFWANTINALLFLVLTCGLLLQHHFIALTFQDWCWMLVYSLSGGVLFYIFWYRGINRVAATSAALITTVAPVSTCVFAFILLNETINFTEIMGMLCVIFSIVFGSGILTIRRYKNSVS